MKRTRRKQIEIAAFKKDLDFYEEGLETLRWKNRKVFHLSGRAKNKRISDCKSCIQNPEIFNFGRFFISCRCSYGAAIIENIRTEKRKDDDYYGTHRYQQCQHAGLGISLWMKGAVIEEGTMLSLSKRGSGMPKPV